MSSANSIAPEVYYRDRSLLQCHVAYEGFFGLKENPFSLTPDPRYLFRTRHAHETLRQLTRGILTRKGLIVLSGDVGTGKTTLLNTALQTLRANPEVGDKTHAAVVVHPTLTPEELVEAILSDFRVPCTASGKVRRLQVLQAMLLEVRRKGGVAVLAIDEAQLLTTDLLNEIGLLLSLKSGQEALLQVVLSGQPETEERISRSTLVRQPPPMTVRCKTAPLTLQDTHDYIEHRLKVAGAHSDSIFTKDAADAAHHHSHGIPRVVNLLCGHALSVAGLRGVRHITAQMIGEAAAKILFPDSRPPGSRPRGFRAGPRPGNGNGAPRKPSGTESVPGNGTGRPLAPVTQVLRRAPVATRRPPLPAPVRPPVPAPWKLRPAILPPPQRAIHWWQVDFTEKRHWMVLCYMAFAGALSMALARAMASPVPWQRVAHGVLGFSGLMLLDVSLGLSAYLFLYERRTRRQTGAPAQFPWAGYRRLPGLFFEVGLRLAGLESRAPSRRS